VYRDPWPVRAARFAKRHRTAVTAAGVMAATGLVALAIGNDTYRRQRDEQRRLKDVALAERDRAERNADATADVVDRFLIEIADDGWARYPGTEKKRLEMARLAVEHYRELSRQAPDDPAIAEGLGNSLRRAGNLCRVIHDLPAARRYHADARGILERIVGSRPDDSGSRVALVDEMLDEAYVVGLSDGPAAAEPLVIAAVAAARSVRRKEPVLAARAALEHGDFLSIVERSAEAVEELSAALAGFDAITTKSYGAKLLEALAATSLARQRHRAAVPGAAAAVDRATALAAELRIESEDEANARFVDASVAAVAGEIAAAIGDDLRAADRFLAAITGFERLVSEYPLAFAFRQSLAEVSVARASWAAKHGEHARAHDDASRALDAVAPYRAPDPAVAWVEPIVARALAARGMADRSLGRGDRGRADLVGASESFTRAIRFNQSAASLRRQAEEVATVTQKPDS